MKALFIIIPAAVIILGTGGYLAYKNIEEGKPSVVAESREDKGAAIQQAYQGSETGTTTHAESCDNYFKKLQQAFATKNKEQLDELVSADDMFDFVDRSGLIEFKSDTQRRQVRKGFKLGLSSGLIQSAEIMGYDDFKVVHIEEIRPNEIIAYARFWDDELEIFTKMRWWLIKQDDDQWAAYDYEDLDSGIRTSTLFGILLTDGLVAESPWAKSFLKIIQGLQGGGGADLLDGLASAEGDIDHVLSLDIPQSIEPFLRLLKVGILLQNGEFEDALEQTDLTEAINPDVPSIHYQRGASYLGLEQWDNAILHLSKYADVLGWDSDVYELMSDAYYGKGDMVKAAEHAELGLKDNPDSWGCLVSFALSSPEARCPELIEHIQNTNDPEFAYQTVLDYVLEEEAPVTIPLVAALKEDFPNNENLELYEAIAEELNDSSVEESD